MSIAPDVTPGAWSTQFNKGATWPATTISMVRDGVPVIPTSAALTIHSPDGTLLLTVNATIDGAGVMTVGPVTAAATAAFTWEYGNLVFIVSESGVLTNLLAGVATVRNYSD